jgi:hypothetical protein
VRPSPNYASGYYPAENNEFCWVVKFNLPFALNMDYYQKVGTWVVQNVKNGFEMIMPRSCYFTTEEDALLVYLRFS